MNLEVSNLLFLSWFNIQVRTIDEYWWNGNVNIMDFKVESPSMGVKLWSVFFSMVTTESKSWSEIGKIASAAQTQRVTDFI